MTTEAQRIAIAEACGIVSKDQWGPLYKTPRGILRDCPDYLADLNAMHEAEKTLTREQADSFTEFLWSQKSNDYLVNSYIWNATAAQRAEAFLRTLGKSEENTK